MCIIDLVCCVKRMLCGSNLCAYYTFNLYFMYVFILLYFLFFISYIYDSV